jgi:two-component system sensor histidine kinase SenX3
MWAISDFFFPDDGLLSNAFEHTAPDNTINIKANRLDEENVQIAISDDGVGMKQGQLMRIKESFEDGDKTPLLYSTGSQIPPDLGQIHYIVTRHGGVLDIEKNNSEGTVVKIKLPIFH